MQTRYCTVCTLRVAAVFRRDNPTAFAMGFSFFTQQNLFVGLRLLERPKGNWNSRRLLERAKRLWNGRKALAALVLFVGRRYYLRPIILWNARSANGTGFSPWNALRATGTAHRASGTREALMERPKGSWNSRRLLEHAL